MNWIKTKLLLAVVWAVVKMTGVAVRISMRLAGVKPEQISDWAAKAHREGRIADEMYAKMKDGGMKF